MALLQAARYYVLTGDEEKAKSWGLNRAIFYAWAKHYGPHAQPHRRAWRLDRLVREGGAARAEGRRCPEGMERVLGECVQRGPRGYFAFGGEEQTPRDFDREVVTKLRGLVDWERAWRAAVEYVRSFPEEVLRDPQRFFRYVYEPVRDTFFVKLLRGEEVRPPPQLAERLSALARRGGEGGQVTLEAFMRRERKSGEG